MNPNTQPLYPDAAQRIMTLAQKTFGGLFHLYSLGLPDNLALANDAFPVLIVDKVAGEYAVGPTQTDDISETVYVHVLVDTKIGLGSPDSDDTVKRQLQTLIEGRDPVTGYLLPTSLMYALRTHLTLQSASNPGLHTINNKIHIIYDAPKRPDMPETREAIIEIEITERQLIIGRD